MTGSPGILCPPLAHSPRSISLQRSEQNGRKGSFSLQITDFLQVGQGMMVVVLVMVCLLQNLSIVGVVPVQRVSGIPTSDR